MIFEDETNELLEESHDETVGKGLKHNAGNKVAWLCKVMQISTVFNVNFSINCELLLSRVKFLTQMD